VTQTALPLPVKRRGRGRPPHPDVLTPAEWGVVHMVRHGMSNRTIAEGRGISLDAVKQHVENAVAKLGLSNRAALRHWRGAPIDSAMRRNANMTTDNTFGTLGQIARHTPDVDRAEAWFRDVLGLEHLYSFPSSVGKLAFFDLGGTRLFLSNEAAEGRGHGEQGVLYFRVADIHAKVDELKSRSVEFTDAPHMIFKHPDGTEEWMAFFKDCDGQTLGLMSQLKS
jgi:DNA-binding CsgD family transcriptional regulator/catechol 2,3-dioxygenase-like lactoylglutathione lyase family enzyme